MASDSKSKEADNSKKTKRSIVSQKDFPRESLQKALTIACAIRDDFAHKGGAPHDIALALNLVPTSGSWRNLCGTSLGYGLTKGSYGANEIVLTELGRRIVAPTKDGDDARAKAEAVLQPTIMREFFEKYDRAKFPSDPIAVNVLISLGLPPERAGAALDILKENGRYTGILKETKTGYFVAIGTPNPAKQSPTETLQVPTGDDLLDDSARLENFARKVSIDEDTAFHQTPKENNRVFISHGKNKKIVNQLKEILTFGKFEPVVSVERETTSIPVPEKVFQDMRSCASGVIHVMSEGELLDALGNTHIRINENVLIEIGAAMALYGKGVILLVEKGVKLPSNLQGLYRCDYEGETLDYKATMKLLKTFNELRR